MSNNQKQLKRSLNDRMLAGVCGGLAQFLGLDPSLVRIAYAILTVFTAFAGVIIYILMWIIVPEEKSIDL